MNPQTHQSMKRQVSVLDVAKAARVSVGTVSNVLNNRKSVAPEYNERVRRAIDELGFVPNTIARQLKKGASNTIGLLVLSNYNPFFNSLAETLQETAEDRGFSVVLGSSAQSVTREDRYVTLFEQQRVRGLIIAPVGDITGRMIEFHRRYPLVIVGETVDPTHFCSVSLDSELSASMAVQHLADTGRCRLALIGGPFDQIGPRIAGAMSAAAAAGVSLELIPTRGLTVDEGVAAAYGLISRDPNTRPDGIFAANDLVGIGLIHTLVSAAITVPDEIAVIGHDNIEFASTTQVPLSSIHQPLQPMASAMLNLLLAEGPPENHTHRRLLFPPKLVERASTVAAR